MDAAFAETVSDKLETCKQVRFDLLFKGDDWLDIPRRTGPGPHRLPCGAELTPCQ